MKLSLLLVLGILISTAYALADEDVKLGLGDSYIKDGVNFTFTKISRDYTNVILCVNNEEKILYEDQIAYFKNAGLEVVDIDRYDKSIEISIDWINGCTNCECTGDCLNPGCKIQIYDEFGELIKKNNATAADNKTTVQENEVIENIEVSNAEKPNYAYVMGLGIAGAILGVFLVWLFWLRHMTF